MSSQSETVLLREAVEAEHNGKATFLQSVPLSETVGQKTWTVTVYVFHIAGHSSAKRAYAWKDAETGRAHTVLGIPPVNSPRDAVKAVLARKK